MGTTVPVCQVLTTLVYFWQCSFPLHVIAKVPVCDEVDLKQEPVCNPMSNNTIPLSACTADGLVLTL